MAPLEVSRSKLSRHLQGLVFRCHKCTFTCSSDHALQLHLQKHAEVKPYQCQLCYYDGSRRSQLEEHLRVEHKVGARGPGVPLLSLKQDGRSLMCRGIVLGNAYLGTHTSVRLEATVTKTLGMGIETVQRR